MRQAAGDHGVGEPLAAGDADALVVHERALAAFGDEHLFAGRIVDQAGDRSCPRARARSKSRTAECRAGSWWCRRADRRSSGATCRRPRARRLPRRESRSRAAPCSAPANRVSSARRSAEETKLAGPLSETCSFSTSPKSRLSARAVLRAAAIITLSRAEWCMARGVCPRRGRGVKSAAAASTSSSWPPSRRRRVPVASASRRRRRDRDRCRRRPWR